MLPKDETRLDELLRRRTELDSRLARYKKEFGVLFADIVGSTGFYERRGDLSGMVMVQEFVSRARAAVEPVGGRVVKSIGDAVLVQLGEPEATVKAAVAVQQAFAEFNRSRGAADRIQVRIGLSWGSGFVKDDDVFGDVVNLAARLEQLAHAGQIICTAALHAAGRGLTGVRLRRLRDTELKGKAAPQELYEVVWPGAPGPEEAEAPRSYSLVLTGSEEAGGVFPLKAAETLLGRDQGEIRFPDDTLMSSTHARFLVDAEGLRVEDLSASGVFLRLREPELLEAGDEILVGRKLFDFHPAEGAVGPRLRLSHQSYPLRQPETLIGRREGDIVFPDDSFLSGLHACLRVGAEEVVLEDLRSTNGTFLKIRGTARLEDGDQVLCGSKLLLVRVS